MSEENYQAKIKSPGILPKMTYNKESVPIKSRAPLVSLSHNTQDFLPAKSQYGLDDSSISTNMPLMNSSEILISPKVQSLKGGQHLSSPKVQTQYEFVTPVVTPTHTPKKGTLRNAASPRPVAFRFLQGGDPQQEIYLNCFVYKKAMEVIKEKEKHTFKEIEAKDKVISELKEQIRILNNEKSQLEWDAGVPQLVDQIIRQVSQDLDEETDENVPNTDKEEMLNRPSHHEPIRLLLTGSKHNHPASEKETNTSLIAEPSCHTSEKETNTSLIAEPTCLTSEKETNTSLIAEPTCPTSEKETNTSLIAEPTCPTSEKETNTSLIAEPSYPTSKKETNSFETQKETSCIGTNIISDHTGCVTELLGKSEQCSGNQTSLMGMDVNKEAFQTSTSVSKRIADWEMNAKSEQDAKNTNEEDTFISEKKIVDDYKILYYDAQRKCNILSAQVQAFLKMFEAQKKAKEVQFELSTILAENHRVIQLQAQHNNAQWQDWQKKHEEWKKEIAECKIIKEDFNKMKSEHEFLKSKKEILTKSVNLSNLKVDRLLNHLQESRKENEKLTKTLEKEQASSIEMTEFLERERMMLSDELRAAEALHKETKESLQSAQSEVDQLRYHVTCLEEEIEKTKENASSLLLSQGREMAASRQLLDKLSLKVTKFGAALKPYADRKPGTAKKNVESVLLSEAVKALEEIEEHPPPVSFHAAIHNALKSAKKAPFGGTTCSPVPRKPEYIKRNLDVSIDRTKSMPSIGGSDVSAFSVPKHNAFKVVSSLQSVKKSSSVGTNIWKSSAEATDQMVQPKSCLERRLSDTAVQDFSHLKQVRRSISCENVNPNDGKSKDFPILNAKRNISFENDLDVGDSEDTSLPLMTMDLDMIDRYQPEHQEHDSDYLNISDDLARTPNIEKESSISLDQLVQDILNSVTSIAPLMKRFTSRLDDIESQLETEERQHQEDNIHNRKQIEALRSELSESRNSEKQLVIKNIHLEDMGRKQTQELQDIVNKNADMIHRDEVSELQERCKRFKKEIIYLGKREYDLESDNKLLEEHLDKLLHKFEDLGKDDQGRHMALSLRDLEINNVGLKRDVRMLWNKISALERDLKKQQEKEVQHFLDMDGINMKHAQSLVNIRAILDVHKCEVVTWNEAEQLKTLGLLTDSKGTSLVNGTLCTNV